MISYAALFKPIDLFDPSTEMVLMFLFALALGLVVLKILLRKRYHALIDQLPADDEEGVQPSEVRSTKEGEQALE